MAAIRQCIACGQSFEPPAGETGSSRCPACRLALPPPLPPPVELPPPLPKRHGAQPSAEHIPPQLPTAAPPPLPDPLAAAKAAAAPGWRSVPPTLPPPPLGSAAAAMPPLPRPAEPAISERSGDFEAKAPEVWRVELPPPPPQPQLPAQPTSQPPLHAESQPTPPPQPYDARPATPSQVRGYYPSRARRVAVWRLAAAWAAAAVFSTIPAVLDVVEHLGTPSSVGVSPWAILLLLAATVQIAGSVYLAQLPDWSTLWLASLATLALATINAMLVVLLLSEGQAELLQTLGLHGGNAHRAAAWCVILLSVSGFLSYALGRFSLSWHHAYQKGLSQTH